MSTCKGAIAPTFFGQSHQSHHSGTTPQVLADPLFLVCVLCALFLNRIRSVINPAPGFWPLFGPYYFVFWVVRRFIREGKSRVVESVIVRTPCMVFLGPRRRPHGSPDLRDLRRCVVNMCFGAVLALKSESLLVLVVEVAGDLPYSDGVKRIDCFLARSAPDVVDRSRR